jgi:aconitate hydratase
MAKNIVQKIISAHLESGAELPTAAGQEVGLVIDQTLTQDTTGVPACLSFEAMGLDRVKTQVSVNYADHNTLYVGYRNADDHQYLRTASQKYGMVFSPAGTGICHQLHLENFAKPGATLLGADSHTPTAGGIGALAIGAGGLSVAMAMGGMPYYLSMPKVVRVTLNGQLSGWASAKDIILHLIGMLSVKGGVGKVFEYAGPGVATLSVPERAIITNMGAELGATTSIFPSDDMTKAYLTSMGRADDYSPLSADAGASYDEEIVVDLSELEPLIATPHMPDNVTSVADLAGLEVQQICIGSCTNSSYADLKLVAELWKGKQCAQNLDVLVAPGSKMVVNLLAREGLLEHLLVSGARLLECACGPCVGVGGSPVSKGVSIRTFNRNFEARSGTKDAQVYLASPAVAAMAALHGKITDPATWGEAPKTAVLPDNAPHTRHLFVMPPADSSEVEVLYGPGISKIPVMAAPGDALEGPVLIQVDDNITTDHILPGGSEVMALRSNLPAVSDHIFGRVDPEFAGRAKAAGCGVIVAGENYGQGSAREHAALSPRYLGVQAVIAKSFARIHRANLLNFGILPLILENAADHAKLTLGTQVNIPLGNLVPGTSMRIQVTGVGDIAVRNDLSERECASVKAGGELNLAAKRTQ